MEIQINETNGKTIATLISDKIEIKETQDVVDLIGNCYYQGASKIIIKKEHLIPDFFELKNGMAGDMLQKFSTYQMSLSIVGDFSEIHSKSMRDFMFESNKTGKITFVNSSENPL